MRKIPSSPNTNLHFVDVTRFLAAVPIYKKKVPTPWGGAQRSVYLLHVVLI